MFAPKATQSISLPHLVLQASASERSRFSRPRASGAGSRKVIKIGSISNRGSSDDLSNIGIRKDVAIFEDQIVLGSFFEGRTEGVGQARARRGSNRVASVHVIILGVFMLSFSPRRKYQKKHGQVLLELTTPDGLNSALSSDLSVVEAMVKRKFDRNWTIVSLALS